MPTVSLHFLAMAIGLWADGLPAPGDLPARAVVARGPLKAFSEPDDRAFPLETLPRGKPVLVLDADEATGWLTIAPTEEAFAWVDQSELRPEGPSLATVVSTRAVVRAGVPGALMPGPVRLELRRGERVRLLERPSLSTRTGRGEITWLAVAALAEDVRFVRAEGVDWRRGDSAPVDPAARKAAFAPQSPEGVDGSAEIAEIEARHRAELNGPIASWRLDAIRSDYEKLKARLNDGPSLSAIDARLRLVEDHERLSRSARAFETVVARSRRRDREVEAARRDLAELNRPNRRPFIAEGLLQPSSRQVDGRRVYALIGTEGAPIAYLDVPPGLDARPVLAQRVGVRGTVGYHPGLRARVIAVRDIESLE